MNESLISPNLGADEISQHDCRAGEYLTFSLAGEEYGVSMLKVREIFYLLPINFILKAPLFVKGIIDLGAVKILVVDLRLRLALSALEYNDRTSIIVVEMTFCEQESALIGLLVDCVFEAVSIKADDLKKNPVSRPGVNQDFILGVAEADRSASRILLDIDRVLNGNCLAGFQMTA